MDYLQDVEQELYELQESVKFKNRYRINSARAQWWNYKNEGYYFITMCTINRVMIFGDIIDGIMDLSPIGKMVSREFVKSFKMRNELINHISVIMPNHIHSIIQIQNPNDCRDSMLKK